VVRICVRAVQNLRLEEFQNRTQAIGAVAEVSGELRRDGFGGQGEAACGRSPTFVVMAVHTMHECAPIACGDFATNTGSRRVRAGCCLLGLFSLSGSSGKMEIGVHIDAAFLSVVLLLCPCEAWSSLETDLLVMLTLFCCDASRESL